MLIHCLKYMPEDVEDHAQDYPFFTSQDMSLP